MKRRPTTRNERTTAEEPTAAAWESCYATPIEAEAHVVRGFLEHYRVPCIVRHDRFSVHPLTFCAFGKVEVLVPSDWVNVARGLIAGRNEHRRPRKGQVITLRALEGRQDV